MAASFTPRSGPVRDFAGSVTLGSVIRESTRDRGSVPRRHGHGADVLRRQPTPSGAVELVTPHAVAATHCH